MDGEERLTGFQFVADLVMDDETDSMVNRVGLFGAPGSQGDRRLAHGPCLDLGQVAALWGGYNLHKLCLGEFGRVIDIRDIAALRLDQDAQLLDRTPIADGRFGHGPAFG